MEKYNLNHLIKVTYYESQPSSWYSYKTEKKFLGIVSRKAGIYSDIWGDYYGDEVPDNHYIIDNIVYVKAKVVLNYIDDYSCKYYFETNKEAENFANQLTSNKYWI